MLIFYTAMLDAPADKDKFTQLYNLYKGFMFNVAFKVLNNKNLAEDAVQEAFFKIARKMSEKNFEIYDVSCYETKGLCGIVSRGCAIDILRKEKNVRENVTDIDDEILEQCFSETSDTENEVISGIEYEKICSLISELPNTYKDILRMRFVLGYSNNEISDILKIASDVVKMRVSRGRAILINNLKKEGIKQ
ncbi:RNA polymerase sigma factor [Clostridia bacterium]|nr:RNA polymerase sigma factor [Clostridia bacterium]